jgi:2-dehydro-3-deoxygalactonokinase
MIGSRQGWREIPYCPCPADLDDLVHAMADQGRSHPGQLIIVPGLAQTGDRPGTAPDVIRGEETQIVGTLSLFPDLAGNATMVLPGTHSKWVRIADSRIDRFATYLTGELFALLAKHSILGRPARERAAGDREASVDWHAFDRGVLAVKSHPAGLAPLLFSARSLFLFDRLSAEASLDYLSGLLIGDEIRAAQATSPILSGHGLALIGASSLCQRYSRAMSHFDLPPAQFVADAAAAGLWRIATRLPDFLPSRDAGTAP